MAFLPAGVPDRSLNDRIPKNDNLSNGFGERTEYKLYVSNLPPELNEDGIRQIFNSYGEVSGVLSPRDAGWAYVTYRNHREAVLAIGKLDDKSPLHLKVEFSKERQTRNVQDWKRHNVSEASHPVETAIAPDFRDSGGFNQLNNMTHRKLEIPLPERLRSRHMVPAYSDEDEILYPVEHDPRTLNPFENALPYPDTNLLWTRGRLAVTDDGRRHVYMGRGYTMYKIPDPYHPRIEDSISAAYETRSHGLYEYGVDQLKNEVGRCELCGTITKMRCGKCSIFYCSRICQKTDWEKHKSDCQALPPLSGISNAIPASMNGDDQLQRCYIRVKPELKERVNILNQRAKETQNLKQQDEKEKDTSLRTPINISQQSKINRGTNDIGRSVFPNGETSRQSKNDVPDISKLQVSSPPSENLESKEKPVSRNILKEQENSIEAPQKSPVDYKKVEESLAFHKKSFLSKDSFTQVIVMINLGNGEYWSQKVEDEAAFAKMMEDLGREQKSIPLEKVPKLKPVIGDLVACQFFDIWHRASIVSINPLTVHYIDYGNDEVLTQNDIRPLGTFGEIPRYARKICVLNAKGTKYEQLGESEKLSVKLISEDVDGVFSVVTPDLEGDSPFQPFKSSQNGQSSQNGPSSRNEPSPNDSSSFPKEPSPQDRTEPTSPPTSSKGQSPKSNEAPKKDSPTPTGNVIDNLEIKDEGVMEIHIPLRKNTYSVTIVPNKFYEYYKKVLMELPAKCIAKVEKWDNYQPKEVDELVLCKRADNDWLRGKVLSVGPPVKVATLDDGRVCLAELCFRMPPSVAELCTFGGTCTIVENDFNVQPNGTVLFQVLSSVTIEGQKGFEVLITAADKKTAPGKAFLSAWNPPPEQVGVQLLELKSDTEVILTAFRSPSLLYVRSLENIEVERFNRLLQQVAKRAQTAPKLKNPPVVGEMVIAKYKEDGNHYRAIVRKIDGDNIHIMYVDFGNVEVSSMKEMLELPEELKASPSGVAKVVLKDVPTDVPLNPELAKYFGLLAGREQPLKIIFEGIPSKDGVELKTTNESVNEKVQQLLTPNWKKTSTAEEKTCYTMRDLETATLGKVGETTNALVLHTEEVGATYFMCPMDIEMVGHVSDILPGQIAKYVANTADHYIPRDLELCIAPFEGSWYRGACLMRNATPTSSNIFFVDYGNISQVEHKDLRLMTKDFMTPPALACICNVQNLLPKKFEKEIPKKVAERLADLLAPNSMIKIKIIMEDEEKNYTIELPDVRDILLKENLI